MCYKIASREPRIFSETHPNAENREVYGYETENLRSSSNYVDRQLYWAMTAYATMLVGTQNPGTVLSFDQQTGTSTRALWAPAAEVYPFRGTLYSDLTATYTSQTRIMTMSFGT